MKMCSVIYAVLKKSPWSWSTFKHFSRLSLSPTKLSQAHDSNEFIFYTVLLQSGLQTMIKKDAMQRNEIFAPLIKTPRVGEMCM